MTAASIEPSPSELVSLEIAPTDAGVRLTVTGEIDSSSAPELRRVLDALLDEAPEELVVDLTGVTFLDSAGLSSLAVAHRRAGAGGVRLRVLASGRAVVRPLKITGLWDLFGAEQVDPAGPA